MINWFNSLNLKPQERRMVIGVLVVFFLLFNIWYVWPHFGDWAKNASKAEEAELKIKRYQTQVNNIARYRALIKELEQDGSTKIAAAEQALSRSRLEEPVLMVASDLCHHCPDKQYVVTGVCQGCLARPCTSCPFGAIEFVDGKSHINRDKCKNKGC